MLNLKSRASFTFLRLTATIRPIHSLMVRVGLAQRLTQRLTVGLTVGLTLSLVSCTPRQVLDGVTNTRVRQVTTLKDLSYGALERQKLDIYLPSAQVIKQKGLVAGEIPMVIFVHGGSWHNGSKADYRFLGEALSKQGLGLAVINYQLYPNVRYPVFVEDTQLAMRWMHDHASDWGMNPNKIFLMGHSAGAFNVVAAIVDTERLKAVGLQPKDFAGVIGIAGPYDYEFKGQYTEDVFKGYTRQEAMPSYKVKTGVGLPPFLLITVDKDELVGPENGELMLKALQDHGVYVEQKTILGTDHSSVIGSLVERAAFLAPATRPVVFGFIDRIAKTR
jgi:acetyl esterase/lipase